MQANEKITCPFCKESSMAKVKNVLDGFTKVGEVLVCMLCGSELGTVESLAESNDVQSNQKIRDLGVEI